MRREHKAAKGDKGARKAYQFIDNLVAIGMRALQARFPSEPPPLLEEVMTQIAHEMCLTYARTELHIPVALPLKLQPRNAEIYAQYQQDGPDGVRAFTSDRIAQIAAQHDVTPRWVQNLVASARAAEQQARAADFAGRQGSLGLGDEAEEPA